ncbi:MAG: DUF3105 domain-containing protein [Actinomycetota bacterium]
MSNRGSKGENAGARLTKAERQEQARLERLKIEREMVARKRNRSIGIALVVAAIVAVVAVVTLASDKGKTPSASGIPTMKTLIDQADSATKAAGCTTVSPTPTYDNAPGEDPDIDHHHIGDATVPTPPPLSTYATVPPASGPHNPVPLPGGLYDSPPDVYQTIHSLEHAGVVIWYAPAIANDPEIARIVEFYKQGASVQAGQSKLIVAPYSYPDQGKSGVLPAGVQMAVVAWHSVETCAKPSLAAAFKFAAQHELVGAPIAGQTYIGLAREPNATM